MKNRIKEILDGRDDISQGELARRIGTAEKHMGRIVQGDTNPSVKLAMRIAWELGVQMEELWISEEEAA